MVAAPDRTDCRLAHPLALGHPPATPVGRARRLGLQRRLDNGFDLLDPVGRFAPPSRSDLPHALQTALGKPSAPQAHRLAIDLQLLSDSAVSLAGRTRQDDPAT